jgi:hypothetical protein
MMKKNTRCLGYTPPKAMWGNDSTDDGFYSFNQNISRALACRDHLGYYPLATAWKKQLKDFGYFSINSGIARALKKKSGHS